MFTKSMFLRVILSSFLFVNGLCVSRPIFASGHSGIPRVIVTLAPFHALVSAVMQGTGQPILLLKPSASPHHYTLRPSEMRLLRQADLIFWGGPELETFLVKSLASIGPTCRIMALDQTPHLSLLPLRRSVQFEQACGQVHAEHSPHIPVTKAKDMHFWLDPHNAIRLVDIIESVLSEMNPPNQAQYRENAKRFKIRLAALDQQLKDKLKPIQSKPYIVFHDAYQYFEYRYGLRAVGAINIHPEIPPSIERLRVIRSMIANSKAQCIFREPQFKSHIVDVIAHEAQVSIGELDPIGEPAEEGGLGYLNLLEDLADSFNNCLTR